jgi:hypothetical protein
MMSDVVTALDAGFNLADHAWILQDPSFLPPSSPQSMWSPMSLLADVLGDLL